MGDASLYDRWQEELANYRPNCGYLRNTTPPYRFCPLGVLCDLSDVGRWEPHPSGISIYLIDGYSTEGGQHDLPEPIRELINFRTNMGHFLFEELSDELQNTILSTLGIEKFIGYDISIATINDELYEYTYNPFPIIKRILEERPQSLFVE